MKCPKCGFGILKIEDVDAIIRDEKRETDLYICFNCETRFFYFGSSLCIIRKKHEEPQSLKQGE